MPTLQDLLRRLLPISSQWKNIGVLLGIPLHRLERIKSDEENVNDRMREMLSEWLKLSNHPPTWTTLTDAVQIVDESLAQYIKQQCFDSLT